MPKDFLSFRGTVQLVTEFLEVAFHTILYLRQVYPSQLFQQRKKYDVPVWESRHPSLNEYLGRVVEAIGEELGKGTLRRVALVVKEATLEETPLERFVFDLDWIASAEQIPSAGDDWHLVEDHLRAFLLKLNAADSYLLPNPPDVTFTVVIELKSDATPPESTKAKKQIVPNEWIPAEERLAPGGKDDDTIGRSSVTPLKSTVLGIISLQMAVEELEPKFGFEDSRRKDRLEQESRRGIGEDRKGKEKAV